MVTKTFDLEEELLEEQIEKQEAKRVLIQLPEGLKAEGQHLASIAERAGAIAIISADPCYGACDLATMDAKDLGVDLVVHYGHTPIAKKGQSEVLFIEARARISSENAVRKALPLLKDWNKIGLVTTVQHIHELVKARKLLLESGKTVVIGDVGHTKYPGQVTGCDYTNAIAILNDADAFLHIGGGRFHAIGVTLATAKPTVVADPFEQRAYNIDKEARKIVIQRYASINEATKAKNFGILIGLKNGQGRPRLAISLKKKLEKTRRNTVLLALREITPEALLQFPQIDAFVNTACPRISIDNGERFCKPVLTINETLVVLDEMGWEQLCKKGWFENTA